MGMNHTISQEKIQIFTFMFAQIFLECSTKSEHTFLTFHS